MSLRSVSRLAAAAVGGDEALLDGRRRRADAGDFDAHRVLQELLGEARDFGRHRGREEQRLARERHQLADPLDVRDEAHVEHAVGLVDDEDLDAGEQQLAALVEVEQAAGRRDQHVGAAHDLRFLVAEGHAADQQGDVELVVRAVLDEAFLDLRSQFAGGFEDERARHARAGAAAFEPREHGQREGCGLAGARLGDAENVAAGERVRDCLRLDGGSFGVTGGFDGRHDLVAKSEFFERHSLAFVGPSPEGGRGAHVTARVAC